ncbi:TonB-dependent receptor plug domain-containing protein, partial [Caulobacter sp.]|uniref:TonB-dependent receptor plug domain-containing protein n=1 Tax=Caulobacter sp. TaxID=78 RepID=UPI002B469456
MALKTKVLLATTMLGSLAAFAPTVTLAQTAPAAAQDATSVEEVVVTGSRIRRDPTNSPTPLIQVSRDDVVATGQASVIDVLADIPALSGSQVPEDTTGSGLNDGGLSVLNLRDLGASRTLTLVDGRRHVGSNGAGLQVDIDTIPRLLIQNVEVITGSNSALYGADAVSGVVNFVLRKDFEGL